MQSLRDTLRAMVPEASRNRARQVIERTTRETIAEWIRWAPGIGSEVSGQDLVWNADNLGVVEDWRRRCSKCDPRTWPTDGSGSPCEMPLRPVLRRAPGRRVPAECPVDRLETVWIRCTIYENWTKERKTPEEKPRRWKNRGRTF